MIFIGDIAYGKSSSKGIYPETPDIFQNQVVVGNLEGPISNGASKVNGLYNKRDVISLFPGNRDLVFTLSNNHIFDYGEYPNSTLDFLAKNGIKYTGIGKTLEHALNSYLIISENGQNNVLITSYGWEAIQCVAASANRFGVNPLRKELVLTHIKELRKRYPDVKLVTIFHWNYEMELYPQPRHRELAKTIIDLGVDAVIGHHPHRVQGIETYNGKPIVYSLGNWYIPHHHFWGGSLSYPEVSLDQLAFSIDFSNNKMKCHWYKYDPQNDFVQYVESNNLDADQKIWRLTPFSGMDTHRYEVWFKKFRVKNLGLPIYNINDSPQQIMVKNQSVRLRDWLINILIKLGLK